MLICFKGALAQNSIKYSNFLDQVDDDWLADIALAEYGTGIKAAHIKEWYQKWEDFCGWVVSEFGEKYNVTS